MLGTIFSSVIATFIYTPSDGIHRSGSSAQAEGDVEHIRTPIRYFDQSFKRLDYEPLHQRYGHPAPDDRRSQAIPQVLMSFIRSAISMLVLSPLLTLLAVVMIFVLVFVAKFIGDSGKYFVRQRIGLANVTRFCGGADERTAGG